MGSEFWKCLCLKLSGFDRGEESAWGWPRLKLSDGCPFEAKIIQERCKKSLGKGED